MTYFHFVVTTGGIFAFLALIHFVSDWIFQTHAHAMVKHENSGVRFWHCFNYTGWFAVALYFFHMAWYIYWACLLILFVSHFYEDTYKPVVWWFRHLRQHPAFELSESDKLAMATILKEGPLGYILMIAVDQIVHLSFLFIVAAIVALVVRY